MTTCPRCHIVHRDGAGLCQTCKRYERNGGVWHTLPPFGEVRYDKDGKPICHVCGMAMDKLAEHARRKHHLTSEEYRKQFGLMRGPHLLCSPKYRNKMNRHASRTKTWKGNFAAIHNHELPVGKRNPHWSPQEVEMRRDVQRKIARLKKRKETK